MGQQPKRPPPPCLYTCRCDFYVVCIYIYQKMSDIHKLSGCRYPIMGIKDGRHVVYVDEPLQDFFLLKWIFLLFWGLLGMNYQKI